MLAARGLISRGRRRGDRRGPRPRRAREFERGDAPLDPALEDIHMNVESRLTELIGEPGRRLHTARSRNDQVATDLRLYARRAALELVAAIDRARLALLPARARARRHAAARATRTCSARRW